MGEVLMVARQTPNLKDRVRFLAPVPNFGHTICFMKGESMKWIDVNERLPEVGEKCWYFFDMVGSHRGTYGGLYEDEEGKVWPGMSIFYCDYGFLTGDVTHWHPDQEEVPDGPFIN